MEKQESAILYGVPKVAYGQDGCTPFPMCVHSCGKYLGIPLDYTRAMAESGVWAVHCAASNVNLCSGTAPVRRLLERGVRVALGSDIAGGDQLAMNRVIAASIRASKVRQMETGEAFLTVPEAYYLGSTAGHLYFGGGAGFQPGHKLHAIVVSKTSSAMSQEEMLRALYLYTRDSFTYLRRPAYAFGAADFMQEDALRILNTGYGNCYCYASLLWYLTRWIGYDSVIYSGTVGSNRAPHSWVEIAFDGRYYIFDSELEMAYRRKKRFDIDLYKFYDYDNRWQYRRPAPAV